MHTDLLSRVRYIPFLVGLLLIALGDGLRGQAWITVTTNAEQATLVIDSLAYGKADGSAVPVQPGSHLVEVLPPIADSWLYTRPSTVVEVSQDDTVHVVLNFKVVYQIETQPFGADIFLLSRDGDIYLGKTPIVLRRENPLDADLLFKREGFVAKRMTPPQKLVNTMRVALQPVNASNLETKRHLWAPPRPRRNWINYGAAAVAVASGVVAAHYKMKADDLFEEYELTGNPELRPEIRRYDTYSAVAVGTMQVGVGVLAIRLILR